MTQNANNTEGRSVKDGAAANMTAYGERLAARAKPDMDAERGM